MALPDIGLSPPPPVDVSSQMRPAGGPGGPGGGGAPPDLASLIASISGGQPPMPSADITPKVLDVMPLLTQIARQVPAIGPDVDRLMVELKAHMAGLPNQLAQLSAAPGSPAPGAPGAGGQGPPSPLPPSGSPSQGAPAPGAPAPPVPGAEMGAMDLAMQLEIKLPSIGKDDPSLMQYIQGFIARLREEVPKVVQGETEPVSPPTQAAPTDSMLSKIPVAF